MRWSSYGYQRRAMTWHTLFAGHDGNAFYYPDQPLDTHPGCPVQVSSEMDASVQLLGEAGARLTDRSPEGGGATQRPPTEQVLSPT